MSEPNEDINSSTQDTDEDEGMAPMEIQNEELAKEYERERRQGRIITYIILALFFCIVIYVVFQFLSQGYIFELDLVNEFVELFEGLL